MSGCPAETFVRSAILPSGFDVLRVLCARILSWTTVDTLDRRLFFMRRSHCNLRAARQEIPCVKKP